jgi:hypothetical protein
MDNGIRTKLFFCLQELFRNGVQGFVPGNSLPLSRTPFACTLDRINEPVRIVNAPGHGIPLGAWAILPLGGGQEFIRRMFTVTDNTRIESVIRFHANDASFPNAYLENTLIKAVKPTGCVSDRILLTAATG